MGRATGRRRHRLSVRRWHAGKVRVAAALTVSVALPGCWYGAPEHFNVVQAARVAPEHGIVIALNAFSVDRPPVGLAAFPDGGSPLALDGGIGVWLCTPATARFARLAVIHEKADALDGTLRSADVVGWRDSSITVRLESGARATVRLPRGVHVGIDTSGAQAPDADDPASPCAAPLRALREAIWHTSDAAADDPAGNH